MSTLVAKYVTMHSQFIDIFTKYLLNDNFTMLLCIHIHSYSNLRSI